tara:strand:- start:21 stop:341 length:321 start_codon:yes stop_codon:yes gene_type:complete
MNKIFFIFLLLNLSVLFSSCATNEVNDFGSLKQKALEIPPDFELIPPDESQTEDSDEVVNEANDAPSDIESMILGNSDDLNSNTSVDQETGSIEEFIEDQFENSEN